MKRMERQVLKWFGRVAKCNIGRWESQGRCRDVLLMGRGLSGREGVLLARDVETWEGWYTRLSSWGWEERTEGQCR